ncbi:glycoside hydrolase [Aspergillus unguis]
MPSLWNWGISVLGLLALPQCIQAKAVFAHFMVANTQNYTLADWTSDITLAKASSIDAFALNAGYGASENEQSFRNAFSVAQELDFKLFFSLDYSTTKNTTWPKEKVVDLLRNYSTHSAYFRHDNGQALVSTFEGFSAEDQWSDIKSELAKDKNVGKDKCCFFIPDWTSVGPKRASEPDVVDGLLSWDAWPYGAQEMNTTEDKLYMDILGTKPYVMPVSPWFYTNLKQFDKNWVWRGDDLWYTRWQQILGIQPQPEYVEIITWNDYGESHYIGPVREHALGVVTEGAPFDYVEGMPHDGWRANLPFLIQQYKSGGTGEGDNVKIEEEVLTAWYRLSPANACGDGKTSGNSEESGQKLLKPGEVLEDKVFFSAVLESNADVKVSIGDQTRTAEWSDRPDGGKGMYYGSIGFERQTGEVVVALERDGETLAEMKGNEISDSCPRNLTNWNAWVGNATAKKTGQTADGDAGENVSVKLGLGSVWVLGIAAFLIDL